MAKAKKGRTTKTSPAKTVKSKAKTSTSKVNSDPARKSRALIAINAIKAALPKGSTIVGHTVRVTLKHPLQAKGVVVACFARQNHVVALLPTLGVKLKVKGDGDGKPDRNNTPFTTLENGSLKAEATKLGERIAKALK